MTDKQTRFSYRLRQSEETLLDAEKMLQDNLTPRSIANKAYYFMFYAVLALFLQMDLDVRISKHTEVLSLFDKEFIHPGKIDRYYSKILHKMFDIKQEVDYRELVELSAEDAMESVRLAREFLAEIKDFIRRNTSGKDG